MSALLECKAVCKTYGSGHLAEPVLRGVSLSLRQGEACALLGPSGSGKTTLLSILGCLLTPTSGEVRIAGRRVEHGSQGELALLRRRQIGFVFQQAQLLPFLTVEENVAVVARNSGLDRTQAVGRIRSLLGRLGIAELGAKRPDQLSGGQRQRVAIARALVHRPAVILADEPTAALDWHNGEAAVQLLIEQARVEKALLIVVTHDTRLVPQFNRVLHIDSGRVFES